MVVGNIELPIDVMADLCRKYGVEELSIFGSAQRDDFRPDSDVDFLVVFRNGDYGPWMGKLTDLEADLTRILGHRADVVPKRNLKWVIRERVPADARVLYVDAD